MIHRAASLPDGRMYGVQTFVVDDELEEFINGRAIDMLREDTYWRYIEPVSKPDEPSYAAALEDTDAFLAQLLPKLTSDDCLMITADHGEMFKQHGETTHGYYIYEGNVRVPLVFKIPGVSTARKIKKTVYRRPISLMV